MSLSATGIIASKGKWVLAMTHLQEVITTRMASGSSISAQRCFTVEDVLQMVDQDEPIMEGSDDEFGDIQEEELHEMQEDKWQI